MEHFVKFMISPLQPNNTYKYYGGEEGLLVLVDAPLAVEGEGQDGQDHHLHRVGHPAQAHHEAQHHLDHSQYEL